MNLVEPIPKEVEHHLRDQLNVGELLLMLLAADLRLDGMYGDSWFVLTDERLLVIQPNGATTPDINSIDLQDIRRIQTKTMWATAPWWWTWKPRSSNWCVSPRARTTSFRVYRTP